MRQPVAPPGAGHGPLVSLALALLLVGAGAWAVHWAVDNTLTRHAEVEEGSTMVVTLRSHRQSAAEHDEAELVEAVVAMCQLEVGGGADPDSLVLVDDDRDLYQVVFTPSLDTADQRQLRGCLEDLRIDHFRATVESMEHRAP